VFDVRDWPIEILPAVEEVVKYREDNKRSENSACPVHLDQCRVWYSREENHDSSEKEVAERSKVDRKSPSS
jgi:hypothetical protein